MTEQEQLIEELAHKLYQQVVSERGFPDTWGTERQEHKDIYIMQANDWFFPILKKYCYLKDNPECTTTVFIKKDGCLYSAKEFE